jgi:hypothetical protein
MKRILTGVAVAVLALAFGPVASAQGDAEYEVTVTNLTGGQVFTPILVVAHDPGVRPFTPGQPASVELETLAEGGDTGPLSMLLLSLPQVVDVNVSAGPLPPGKTTAIRVGTQGEGNHVSVLAMLVPTNDGMVALNTVPGPRGNQSAMFLAYAWDAGTEANDESCDSIPGPPGVCGGEGFNMARTDPADFVRTHSGIHGVGDLMPSVRDWRNPVGLVIVTRLPGGGDDDEGPDDDEGHDDTGTPADSWPGRGSGPFKDLNGRNR